MNNKVVVIFEMPGLTASQYDAILAELKAQGKLTTEKRCSHVAFQKSESWCVIDVWESEKDIMEMGQETLFPIFGKLGITPVPPAIYPVHNFIGLLAEQPVEA